MPAETVRLTRQALYDLVWSEPMRTLAVRYAISNVGLAKTCRRMGVPVPGRGYWRRKETGHPVIRDRLPTLPASAGPDMREAVLTLRAKEELDDMAAAAAPDGDTPADPAQRQALYEADPAHRIAVAETLEAAAPLHPLVRQTQAALRGAPPGDRGLLYPFVRDGFIPWGSSERMARYERMRATRPPAALHVTVTPPAADRGLRVLDALLKALEARGYPVHCDLRRGQPAYGYIAAQYATDRGRRYVPVMTRVEVGDEDVFLLLREVVSRVEKPPSPPPPPAPVSRRRTSVLAMSPVATPAAEDRYDFVGSGRFVLTIPHTPGNYSSFWTWEEGKGKRKPLAPLEDVLGDVVVAVVAAGDAFHAWREQARARERDAHERARREWEEQQRRAAETARAQRLEQEASAYATAANIRAYAAALRAAGAPGGELVAGPLLEWVAFAEAYADRIDPVRRTVKAIHCNEQSAVPSP